jgi:hypothetical protein
MNKILLLLTLAMLWQLSIAQQNGIAMKSQHYEEVLLIPENSRIKIQTKEGLKISGEFQITVLNNLYIDGELIALENIRVIRTNALAKGRKVAGGLMLAGGLALIVPFFGVNPEPDIDDVGSFFDWFEAKGFSTLGMMVGIPTAIAGASLLAVKKKYMFDDWEFKIAIPHE